MKYNIFCKQAELRERNPNKINNLIAEQFIQNIYKRHAKMNYYIKQGIL